MVIKMQIDLSGIWHVRLEADNGVQEGEIQIPGILQNQGYGNPITHNTPWVSSLHDPFWYEQEEYQLYKEWNAGAEKTCEVPFLSQPPLHFLGKAFYERIFEVTKDTEDEWFFRIEHTHWRSFVWLDGNYMGEDCSLCTAHEIPCGRISRGKHVLKVCVDNAMQHPYRPDGHGVSDALGATWNGMAGQVILETGSAKRAREEKRKKYAQIHPRSIAVENGHFILDGNPLYLRATHFGGEYPLTGYPYQDKEWWRKLMRTIKEWGLNAIRCHSYCPPEIAFQTADEEDVCILVECGMWNHFEEGIPMLDVLRNESRRILKEYGHHPSFVFFSPTNEPDGDWYQVLLRWVQETKEYDKQLGYEGRRLYTAQSGWFYHVPPAEITGTDFVYFHRSAYGPYLGGKIRGDDGWRGKDYSPSLEGVKLPVVCHELGQWCAYPDFRVIDKFTGYLKPGNFHIFRRRAEKMGLLPKNELLNYCSGRGQVRLYKEELEANYRTPELDGFELLDLHDYLGQGTALVGLLDPFWDSKGYVTGEEFREFCGETVLLIRCPSYVWHKKQKADIPVEICHFGKEDLRDAVVNWELCFQEKNLNKVYASGKIPCSLIPRGERTGIGNIQLDFNKIEKSSHLTLKLTLGEIKNHWDFYVYAEVEKKTLTNNVLYTHDPEEVKKALREGLRVVYAPWISDLDYECPSLSMKNVYWNSQMGPTWGRSLGMVVDEKHPVFRSFPTDKDGGWQWEDILARARGICLDGVEAGSLKPIVRIIDDWNRSLPLAMMLEAKVGDGKLLMISADLEGSFLERPAAFSLKQAILEYADSDSFQPEKELDISWLERHLFPVLRMETLVESCSYDKDAVIKNKDALFHPNPNKSTRIEREQFPVTVEITLKQPVEAEGFLYLPEQRDRGHEGFLKDYSISFLQEDNGKWLTAVSGTFLNTSLSQKACFMENIKARKWRITVFSCYGCVKKSVWSIEREGWKKATIPCRAVLQIAGLHLICQGNEIHNNQIFWGQEQRTATKEIEA